MDFFQIIRTIVVAFIISLILGPITIPMLKKLHIGQSIREEGPQSHLSKSGTPTMGGIIILLSLLITVATSGIMSNDLVLLLASTFGFGVIGFIDDYIIVVKKRNLGLKAYQKLIAQIVLAIILAIYQSRTSVVETKVIVPFLYGQYLDLGILYIPFIVFVVVGTVNSVNLTDGLDGLASGVSIIVLTFFTLVATNWGLDNISLFSSSLIGACLGFLIHNAHPAKVFMGDTGSLALGGAIAAIAILMNLPLMLPIVGGIFFIETISVIIQVTSYKLIGKRVFLMSPLHHHFEQKGWPETKVVGVFWVITALLCIIGIISLKL
ncbi:MAG: phospho-N-acetylmuramoyl-pentapeptide-transferase [Tissierellia bacterium]|nr:phospho-N-acetylmuramoyl-pentapeptide-transferase [Tissierellia bacterium]MDD4725571.1 phospho-N-acetylmuramoyl-pentapeptide-transferase [Tissierellia bacterium]